MPLTSDGQNIFLNGKRFNKNHLIRDFVFGNDPDSLYYTAEWIAKLVMDKFGIPISTSTIEKVRSDYREIDLPKLRRTDHTPSLRLVSE